MKSREIREPLALYPGLKYTHVCTFSTRQPWAPENHPVLQVLALLLLRCSTLRVEGTMGEEGTFRGQ